MRHGQLLIRGVLTQGLMNRAFAFLGSIDERKRLLPLVDLEFFSVALIGQTLFGNLDFSSTVLSMFDAANGEIVETSRVFLQR